MRYKGKLAPIKSETLGENRAQSQRKIYFSSP